MRILAIMGIFVAVAMFSSSGIAAAPEMPSVATIVQKMDTAVDPKQKMKLLKSFQVNYEGEFPLQGIKVEITSIFKSPDRMRRVIRIAGMPDTVEVCNGKDAWTEVAGLGSVQATGNQLSFKLLVVKLTNPANRLTDIFPKIELAPQTEQVEGKTCYKLSCFPEPELGLPPLHFYVDCASFLAIKLVMIADSEMGQVPAETVFSDYRAYDDVYLPVTQVATSLGMTMTTRITAVKFNVATTESDFMPTATAK